MSASNKKKLRKELQAANMTERQRKEAKELKKIKAYTFTFWAVLVLCVCIVLTTVLSGPVTAMLARNTKAVNIGEHTLTSAELNYFFIDAVSEWYNSYGSYAMYFGLDTTKPLDEQDYDKEAGTTWADTFVEMAVDNIKSTYALYDMAIANGHKLTEDEQKSLDSLISDMEETVKYYKELYEKMGYAYNYKNAKQYLQGIYGKSATIDSYENYYKVCVTASSYYNAHSESLDFNAEDLRAFEADKIGQYDSYNFAYYYFNATNFREGGTKSEDGKTTTYTDEEKQAAIKVAEQLANELAAGTYADLDAFDKAINEMLTTYFDSKKAATTEETTGDETIGDETTGNETTGDETTGDDTTGDETDDKKEETLKYSSTKKEDQLYSSVNSLFIDWMIGKVDADGDAETEDDITYEVRKEGDLTVIVNKSGSGENEVINGYYVVRYGSLNDNTFALKNVRHILVAFEGGTTNSTTGQTTYTDAEKLAAKKAAEELMAEFKGSKMTEEIFSEMANEHSDDQNGNVTNGGLYEDIYPGQMVEAFEEWCYDEERKEGDVGLVETTYGWHVMYFVGDSETNYRDFMVENDLHSDTMTKWMEAMVEKISFELLTDKFIDKDMILGS